MIDCQAIRKRWETVGWKLDERGRRVFAAGEVRAAGWGGLEAVSKDHGSGALDHRPRPEGSRRCAPAERPGSPQGWRPASLVEPDPTLIDDLRRIVEPATLGCPVRPLLWVSEEPRQAGCRLAGDGSQDQRQQRAQTVAGARLQPAIEPQGGRGLEASRPRRAVRTHQRQGDCGAGCGPARHLGGHEEERCAAEARKEFDMN